VKTKYHVISAVPLGIGYYLFSTSLPETLLAITISIIIDMDHLIDYAVTQKRLDSLPTMVNAFKTFRIVEKNYFLLHSWELVILSGLFTLFVPNPYFIAVFVGYTFHVLGDQIYNTFFLGDYNLKIFFYFLFYRYLLKFDVLKLRQRGNVIDKNDIIY